MPPFRWGVAIAGGLCLAGCADAPTGALPPGSLQGAVVVATYHGVLATIPVGGTEITGSVELADESEIGPIRFSPDGGRVYVGCGPCGGIAVLDAASGVVVDSIGVQPGADFAVSPDGSALYIAQGFDNQSVSRLLVVSAVTGEIVDSVRFQGSEPRRVGVGPDGTVYLAFNLLGIVVVPDGSGAPLDTVPPGDVVGPFAFSADGQRLYVAADGLVVLETGSRAVVDTILPGSVILTFAIDSDRNRAYIRGASTLSIVDLTAGTVVATVAAQEIGDIALSPDGTLLYMVGADVVSVISTATNAVTTSIPFTERLADPTWLAVNPR